MADSVVSLGLDLSAFEATLRQGFEGLDKRAQRSLANAKQAAAEAVRESARAATAAIKQQDQAAREAARAAADRIREEQSLAREVKARAAEQQRAAAALSRLAAGRSEVEQLTQAYREQIAEIQRLVEVTGDQESGAKAVAAATARHQSALEDLKGSADGASAGLKSTAGASYALKQQAQSLQKNLLDVVQSLVAGQAPMQVLSQQGPQLAEAFAQAGDTAGLLKEAFGGVIAAAAPIATALAAAAVAAAALGTAYVVVANQTESAATSTAGLVLQVEASRAALDRARASTSQQAAALRGLAASAATAQEDLAVLVGTADRHEVTMRREIAAMEDRNRASALAATANLAAAETALQNERALLRNTNASVTARAEASAKIKALEQEIRAQQAVVAQARQTLDSEREAIELAADYRRETEASEAALQRRAEAQQAAAAASAAAAEADREAAAAAKEAAAAQAAAATAAREWAMQQGMVAAAAQDLARVAPELEALVALLEQAAAVELDRVFADLDASVADTTSALRDGLLSPISAAVGAAKDLGQSLSSAAGVDLSGGLTTAIIGMARDSVEAERDALAAVADARAGLREAVASGDAGAIAEARAALATARTELQAARPEAFVTGLIEGAADMVQGIVDALPAVVDGLVSSAPALIDGIIGAIPDLVVALAEASPQIAIDLATALAIQLPIQLLAAAPQIAVSLARGIAGGFVEAAGRIRAVIGDIFREIATGGRADTRTFGDTPGVQRVGPSGARVSPGDYVVAARSREGLQAQLGGSPQAAPVVVTLDVRDGPVRLGISRAVSREQRRQGAGRDTTGRRSPYTGASAAWGM